MEMVNTLYTIKQRKNNKDNDNTSINSKDSKPNAQENPKL